MSTRFLKANGQLDPGHMMRTLGIHSIPTLDIHEPVAMRHTRILETETGPKADMVALNASAAFVVSGIATDIRNGLEISREILADGRALQVLEAWREFG